MQSNNIARPDAGLNIKIKSETAARDLQSIFKAFAPQFYRNKSAREIQNEQAVINAAIMDIAVPVLKKMAELAVQNYKIARSFNKQVYFNLDYFLEFFAQAFNAVNYFVPKCRYTVLSETLDGSLETVTLSLDDAGAIVTMRRYIDTPAGGRARGEHYSELSLNTLVRRFEDICI